MWALDRSCELLQVFQQTHLSPSKQKFTPSSFLCLWIFIFLTGSSLFLLPYKLSWLLLFFSLFILKFLIHYTRFSVSLQWICLQLLLSVFCCCNLVFIHFAFWLSYLLITVWIFFLNFFLPSCLFLPSYLPPGIHPIKDHNVIFLVSRTPALAKLFCAEWTCGVSDS